MCNVTFYLFNIAAAIVLTVLYGVTDKRVKVIGGRGLRVGVGRCSVWGGCGSCPTAGPDLMASATAFEWFKWDVQGGCRVLLGVEVGQGVVDDVDRALVRDSLGCLCTYVREHNDCHDVRTRASVQSAQSSAMDCLRIYRCYCVTHAMYVFRHHA